MSMLERRNRLESLEQLSLTALYEDIVAQLLPTTDSSLVVVVNNKRSSLFSVLPHCNPVYHSAKAENKATNAILQIKVVDSIRQKLCLPLFCRVRSQLVEEYCKHQQQQHTYTSASDYSTMRRPDIHLFLDCILNEDLTSFELNASMFPSNKMHSDVVPGFSPTKLLNTIVDRCPYLESLTIHSYYPNLEWDSYDHGGSFSLNSSFCQPLFNLKNLVKLDLNWNWDPSETLTRGPHYVTFLSHIGESCPKLKYLKLGSTFPLSRVEHFLALFLGQSAISFTQSVKIEELHRIQIAEEYIAPFCRSLEHLELRQTSADREKLIPIVAFLLRHLPRLQTWAVSLLREGPFSSCVFDAIQLLFAERKQLVDSQRSPIDNRKVEDASDNTPKFTIDSLPPQKLELQHVEAKYGCVDVSSLKIVEAVVSMCPNLKEIYFIDSPYKKEAASPLEIGSLLTIESLSEVTVASFSDVPIDYCIAVLSRPFGSRLVRLNIAGLALRKNQMDLVQLLSPCYALQDLVIERPYCFPDKSDIIIVPPVGVDFLPNLQTLDISSCLGQWSRLFETTTRPALTNLSLYCSHIGVKEASDYQWTDAFKLWPNMRHMDINFAKGLPGMSYVDVLPLFEKLEHASIPRPSIDPRVTEDKRIQTNVDLVNKMRRRPSSNNRFSLTICRSVPDFCLFK